MERLTSRIGFWSAVFSFVFAMGYIVFQAVQWAGLTPPPWHLITLTFPSFWLALSFVILMISVYHYASDERKIWGHIAVAFAIMYATLNAAVYFLQMTVVVPFMLNGQVEEVAFITLSTGTFVYGLDVLGYSLMSLATLFAAPVFTGGGLERSIRWSLVANGLLTPALLLQQNFPTFAIAALWAITFPVATALLAVLFKRKMK
jgi:hypothetical protein